MEVMSVAQVAEKMGISMRRVQILLSQNWIPRAVRVGRTLVLPADVEKPKDERIKSGKYVKNKNDR